MRVVAPTLTVWFFGVVVILSGTAHAKAPRETNAATIATAFNAQGVGAREGDGLAGRLDEGVTRDGRLVARVNAKRCEVSACIGALGDNAGAEFTIVATVSKHDNVYQIGLEAYGSSGDVVASSTDRCKICGIAEAGDMLADRAAVLTQRVSSLARHATVTVTSDPAGASLRVDGTAAGPTPVTLELTPGAHQLELSQAGYAPQTHDIDALRGVKTSLAFRLSEQAVSTPRDPKARLIAGSVTTAVGLVMVASGAPLLWLHRRPYTPECRADREGNCARLYDTAAAGGSLVGLGSAAAIAGAVVLIIDARHRNRAPSTQARLRWGGTSVRF